MKGGQTLDQNHHTALKLWVFPLDFNPIVKYIYNEYVLCKQNIRNLTYSEIVGRHKHPVTEDNTDFINSSLDNMP